MVKLLETLLSSCTAFIGFTSAFQLNCESTEEAFFVDGFDATGCNCYGPGNNKTTFDWTLFHDSGRRDRLAICYSIGNCTSFYGPSLLQSTLTTTYSNLYFYNLTSQFSGVLTCTQTNSTFNGSASFRLTVKKIGISICNSGVLLWEGGVSAVIDCVHSPYTPSTVTWTIYTHSRKLIQLGSCCSSSSNNYSCTSLLAPNITLTGDKDDSSISFQDSFIDRDYAIAISSFTFNSSVESDNCTMIVYSIATVENCSVHISRQNWSFIMYFDVSNAFNSGGLYTFLVYESFEMFRRDDLLQIDGTTVVGYRSYRQYLTSYINSTSNKLYYRGRVVHSWPLSPYPGIFTGFTVITNHGGTNSVNYEKGLNFSLPVRPTHNCSEVMTSCSCSTETLGSPAGRLLWLIGNITVAVGDYGANQLLLPADSLPIGQDVTIATCQLDWVQVLIAKEPAVLLRTSTGSQYKSLATAGWTLFSVVIIINGIIAVFSVRQGHSIGCRCTNKAEEEEDVVTRSIT